MLSFLLLTLVSFQPAPAADGCEALMTRARAAVDDYLREREPDALTRTVTASRAARACYGEDHAAAADTYNYETYALTEQRQYRAARDAFDRFFRRPRVATDSLLLSKLYRRSGYVAKQLGQFHRATDHFGRAQLYAVALPAADRVPYLTDAAEALQFAERHGEARQLYREARRILEPLVAHDRSVREPLARVRLKEAESYAVESNVTGRLAADTAAVLALSRSALDLLDGARSDWQLLGPLLHASNLTSLGSTAAALPYLQHAYRLAQASPNPHRRTFAGLRLGESLIELDRPREALPFLEEALRLAIEIGAAYDERYLHQSIGDAQRNLGAIREAEASYWNAISATERLRTAMAGSEVALSTFGAWQEPYRALTGLLLQQGRTEEAFDVLDRTRARYLQDQRLRQRIAQRLPAAERTRLRRLGAREDSLRALIAAEEASTHRQRALALQSQVQTVQAAREALLRPLLTFPEQPRVADLQRHLGGTGRTLVSYFLREQNDGDSYAFVVRTDTLVAVPLGLSAETLRERMARVSSVWTGEVRQHADTQFDLGALHALYDVVFAPLVPHLPDGSAVVVVPDGELVWLPFAMLVVNDPPRYRYEEARFLVQRHALSMELAAAVMLEPPRPHGDQALDLLAIGRSRFGYPAPTAFRSGSTAVLPDLPYVPQELDAIRQGFARVHMGLDERATEHALMSEAGRAHVVHVASHVQVFPDQPEISEIQLWPDSAHADDGVLHLYELVNASIPADLVVLSGCSSARGQRISGEGMVGFQYALRAAGADAVLATLWQVDDRATVALMASFYEHLRTGLSKDRALQQAQIDYLRDHRGAQASPFYWAAPVLTGSSQPLPTPSRGFALWWIVSGLGALAVALLLPRLRRPHG